MSFALAMQVHTPKEKPKTQVYGFRLLWSFLIF
jgi:hypothetical protein